MISKEWWITLNISVFFFIKQIYIKHTADISYTNTPNAHQSTALLYPLDKIISGAKYSKNKFFIGYSKSFLIIPGVPHNVQVRPKNQKNNMTLSVF